MKKNYPFRQFMIGWAIIIGLADFGTSVASASPFHQNVKSWLMAHPWAMNAGLNQILSNYCHELSILPDECNKASDTLIDSLDLGHSQYQLDEASDKITKLSMVFKKNLVASLEDPNSFYFLSELSEEVAQLTEDVDNYSMISPNLVNRVNLTRTAQKHFGDSKILWQRLGALFQDIPASKVQIYWAIQNKKLFKNWSLAFANLELLNQLLIKIEGLGNTQGFQFLVLAQDVPFRSSKIYHQIVAGSLASEMKEKGISDTNAILLPFLFNFIYEAQADSSSTEFLFTDNILIHDSQNQLDILDGLDGASWAVKKIRLDSASISEGSRELLLRVGKIQ